MSKILVIFFLGVSLAAISFVGSTEPQNSYGAPGSLTKLGWSTSPQTSFQPQDILVITRRSVLETTLGPQEASRILDLAAKVGEVHSIDEDGVDRTTPSEIAAYIKSLYDQKQFKAVLILGNHDIIPFWILENPARDDDNQIYTDDPYVNFDQDSDNLLDIPIARLPESKDAELLATQLSQPDLTPASGSFIYYARVPMFPQVYEIAGILNQETVYWSPPLQAEDVTVDQLDVRFVYIVPHGSDVDTSRWWGRSRKWTPTAYADEYRVTNYDPVAFKINKAQTKGMVMIGACYGAWVSNKTPDNSIALRFLKNGARCFVGATMEDYQIGGFDKLFFSEVAAGENPLQGTFNAKKKLLEQIKASEEDPTVPRAITNIKRKVLLEIVYFGRP